MTVSIGALSKRTGVKIETIRYYEKIGLMPPAPRKESGHRYYTQALAMRLRFIRRGRELGFSLEDIRALLGLEDGRPSCSDVYAVTTAHIKTIKDKISDLRKLEKTLSAVAQNCDQNKTPDCAIMKTLFDKR